ncbi:MAG: A/G-specific adenine glycosylase [Desulfotalea sp.]|nr:MAG: A/G-specific adenine glycosylase [Desulfotalea sp.]
MLTRLSQSESNFLVEQLLTWFRTTKRDLPWRQTYDPYHVWISEIMLQQTQMERGVAYFLRWIERFPSVGEVACASEDDILVYWEGLGYYARARNLHRAAQEIVGKYSGKVPADYETLLNLPGIGPYTAAAVASIAGNQDVVVVDANVNRMFARIFDIDEPVKDRGVQKQVHQLASELLPRGKARIFNQALMDFGGLVCTPKAPHCKSCRVQRLCSAYQRGTVSFRPVLKSARKVVLLTRVVAVILCEGKVFMQKRESSAVWGGLWEFPGGETLTGNSSGDELDLVAEVNYDTALRVIKENFLVEVQHQYTHHKVSLLSFVCRLQDEDRQQPTLKSAASFAWVTPLEMDALPCPSGVRKIIKYMKKQRPEMFTANYAA